MSNQLKRIRDISRAVDEGYYSDLGVTEITDDSTLEDLKIRVLPSEGVHAGLPYTITVKFQEEGSWPLVYIDSVMFDQIKTGQYVKNKGKVGDHKGICIKHLGYGYNFHKNFRELCGNMWVNYIYNLIVFFNNIQDFEKGNGFKSKYKEILAI
jgi:hypothetical protein